MANALYDTFKEGLLNKELDLNTDVIKATLSDAAYYTYSAAHDFYAGATPDVPATAKTAESAALTSPTITNGTFDTADFTWSSVPTENPQEQIILWDDTITDDRLVCFFDTGMTGMPVTPNGGDINVTVHTSGWFAL
jgi:hypothetical protein